MRCLLKYERRTGFTLIELLIVVAIIAILAAIAVPNFLEAQTRAKVSRAKADMRSVRTGLESYAVDFNKYPDHAADTWHPSLLEIPQLSTPVAYLTALERAISMTWKWYRNLRASGNASLELRRLRKVGWMPFNGSPIPVAAQKRATTCYTDPF